MVSVHIRDIYRDICGLLGTIAGGNIECVSDFYPSREIGAVHSIYYFGNCHRKRNRVADLFFSRMVERENYE